MVFKRTIALLLAGLLVLSCAGCSKGKKGREEESSSSSVSVSSQEEEMEEGSPAAAAAAVLDGFKNVQMEQLKEAIADAHMREMAGEAEGLLKALTKNMSYELGEVTITGDTAVVPAVITNKDFSGLVNQAIPALIEISITNPNAAEEELAGLILDKLAGLVEDAGGEPVSAEVKIRLVREDGEWKAEKWEQQEATELLDAVSGGMFAAFLDMAGQLESLAG